MGRWTQFNTDSRRYYIEKPRHIIFPTFMKIRWFRLIAAATFWSTCLFGFSHLMADKNEKNPSNISQESETGTEQKPKSKTIKEELRSASPVERKQVEFGIEMQLHRLMYPGLENFERAVKMFQKDLGEESTGDLTIEQLEELNRRVEGLTVPDFFFPTTFASTDIKFMLNGSATVRGTATILANDETIASPVNQVTIECNKREKLCELRMLFLARNEKTGSWLCGESTHLFEIISWTDDSIEAKSVDDAVSVRTSSLSLNFKTKEFFWITKNSGRESDAFTGEKIEPLKTPRIVQFVDGKKIVSDYFKKLKADARSFWSSEFRRKAETLSLDR